MQNRVLCYWERSSPLTSCLTSLTCTLVNNMAPTNVSSGLTNGLHLFYSPSSSWLYDGSGPRCKGIPLRDKLPEMAMLKGIVSLTQVLLFPLSQSYALASNFFSFGSEVLCFIGQGDIHSIYYGQVQRRYASIICMGSFLQYKLILQVFIEK